MYTIAVYRAYYTTLILSVPRERERDRERERASALELIVSVAPRLTFLRLVAALFSSLLPCLHFFVVHCRPPTTLWRPDDQVLTGNSVARRFSPLAMFFFFVHM